MKGPAFLALMLKFLLQIGQSKRNVRVLDCTLIDALDTNTKMSEAGVALPEAVARADRGHHLGLPHLWEFGGNMVCLMER